MRVDQRRVQKLGVLSREGKCFRALTLDTLSSTAWKDVFAVHDVDHSPLWSAIDKRTAYVCDMGRGISGILYGRVIYQFIDMELWNRT